MAFLNKILVKQRFTKYGFVNALWSLIPIFPIWTLFPAVLVAKGLEDNLNDCEASYRLVLWITILLAILLMTLYIYKIDKILLKPEKDIKHHFRFFFNTLYFGKYCGINNYCWDRFSLPWRRTDIFSLHLFRSYCKFNTCFFRIFNRLENI